MCGKIKDKALIMIYEHDEEDYVTAISEMSEGCRDGVPIRTLILMSSLTISIDVIAILM